MFLPALARWCYRHRRLVLAFWIVGLVGTSLLSRAAGGAPTNNFNLPSTESQKAFTLLQTRFRARSGDTVTVAIASTTDLRSPVAQARVESVLNQYKTYPHVIGVQSPYTSALPAISPDGTVARASIQLDGRSFGYPKLLGDQFVHTATAASGPGFTVALEGNLVNNAQRPKPGGGEVIGLLAAIVILLVSFGSVLAMGLPIVTALFGIGIGIALIGGLMAFTDVPNFADQLAAMIGIGVGIDYALFIVTRYRAALDEELDPEQAVVKAINTSGRAVLFAGCTVIISLLGMLLMGIAFVRGLALGAVAAVLMTMFASVTLLPAILGFVGFNIDRLRLPGLHRSEADHRGTFWYRWSRFVQRRPALLAAVGLGIAVLLTVPAFSMRLGSSDSGNDPKGSTTRTAYDLLSRGFGPGANGVFLVAAEVPPGADRAVVDRLAAAFRGDPDVAGVTPPVFNSAGDTAVISVTPKTSPQAAATGSLLHRMRQREIPAVTAGTGLKVHVGGQTAIFADLASLLGRRLPLFIGAVVGLSFLLLLAVFRSILVPLKAAVMNLLSIGAAYGVVVAVFQWGWGSRLLGLDRAGPIEAFLPMMLFAILFGLSMDYEVFLLSRVREEWLRTNDNGEAVADGLAATARVITAAAAIMVTIFLSFVFGDNRIIKLFGLGLSSAILIDATLIRMVIVPATMELLGEANWWLPAWLDRILPAVHVEQLEAPSWPNEAKVPEPVG